jgi:hypothetical protein
VNGFRFAEGGVNISIDMEECAALPSEW